MTDLSWPPLMLKRTYLGSQKIKNLKEVDPTTLMENLQPELNQNSTISEAYNQLNFKLQEMKCLTDVYQNKQSRKQKSHKNYGSVTPYANSKK